MEGCEMSELKYLRWMIFDDRFKYKQPGEGIVKVDVYVSDFLPKLWDYDYVWLNFAYLWVACTKHMFTEK